MKGYPSYDDPTELTATDVQRIAELATDYIGPDDWTNRDSPSTFEKVTSLAAYLRLRSNPQVEVVPTDTDSRIESDERTIWVRLNNVPQKEFDDFDELYYLPTEQRLEETRDQWTDWY
jgi:hypothetical protein